MRQFSGLTLYDFQGAPSPRRVRVFLTEKGIVVPTVQVALHQGEQLEASFRAVNPRCEVPALRLEDKTVITEAVAICRYFEELQPDPPLFGKTAVEKALVCMWNRRVEWLGFIPIAETLRNAHPAFKDRALTGPVNFAQIPELAERGRARIPLFFEELDRQLSKHRFLAGERFSIADISALVCVDFAKRVELGPDESQPHLQRWIDEVSARPSAMA